MRSVILSSLVALALCLTGCTHRVYGPTLSEPVTVEDKVYTPATHGTGVGMSTRGSLVVTSVDTEEVFAVVFHCQHGSFIIKRPEVFKQVLLGDSLTCYYREVFEVDNDDSTKVALVDYDFLRVEKTK